MARLRLFLFFTLVCLVAFRCGGSGGGSATTGTTGIGGQGKWTVLIYMNAANNLDRDSDLNVIQMQKAPGNPLVRIVAQGKQTQALYPQARVDAPPRYPVK